MTKKIKIPYDTCIYIEQLQYEKDAKCNLCSFMIRQGMQENENFKKYHTAYIENYMKYEEAKKSLYDDYIAPHVESNNFEWNLDFASCEVTLVEQ